MARSQERSLKPIADDLDPKGATVAWYDVTNPALTYADEDGKTPAEATALIPVPDPDNDGDWLMKELWTTPESYKKYFSDTYKRLEGADSAGSYVVKEKSEWDKMVERIDELEDDNAELLKRPASGGKERRKYGSGTPRRDTKHIRVWLHVNGHEVSTRGRIPEDDMKKFNAANPSGEYTPTADELKGWDAFKGDDSDDDTQDQEQQLDFDGDHGSQSEREAASRVRNAAEAPEPQEDEEEGETLTDDQMRALLREAGDKPNARKDLTQAEINKAIKLHEAKATANA
jgi:hypothetical protein